MMIMKKTCTLYLVFILISFIGFSYETILAIIFDFSDIDRGFLRLPLCPIYGSGVIITYLLFGTPKNLKIINRKIKCSKKVSIYIYFLLSAVLASILEYLIGNYFEKQFNIVLWSYNYKLNFDKYCSLVPSIGWGIAITLFMNYLFDNIYLKIYKIKKDNLIIISITTFLLILVDFFTCILK